MTCFSASKENPGLGSFSDLHPTGTLAELEGYIREKITSPLCLVKGTVASNSFQRFHPSCSTALLTLAPIQQPRMNNFGEVGTTTRVEMRLKGRKKGVKFEILLGKLVHLQQNPNCKIPRFPQSTEPWIPQDYLIPVRELHLIFRVKSLEFNSGQLSVQNYHHVRKVEQGNAIHTVKVISSYSRKSWGEGSNSIELKSQGDRVNSLLGTVLLPSH
ncbi:unnamed protein product [Allacma fusca]|uniref:Uncharacterized protein n=1 Tax=Allacma fusca TaxID=39272 RepID=A0A8J2KZD4_9HEXA|nr:unnamed protein product [Allacma fusca]